MAKLKTRTSRNSGVKSNRALKISVAVDTGENYLQYAENAYPMFVSLKDIEEDTPVTILIKNDPVWKIEAGAKVRAGQNVYVGEEGRVFERDGDYPSQLFGYVVNDAEEGEIVEVVRAHQMNGNWIKKVEETGEGE